MFGPDTTKLMFCNDFKKHVQILGKFVELIESNPINLIENIDIIFKWIYIKQIESNNTTFASCVFDSLSKLFE